MKSNVRKYNLMIYFHLSFAAFLIIALVVSFIFSIYAGILLLILFYLFNSYNLFLNLLLNSEDYQNKRFWFSILFFVPGAGGYLFLVFEKISYKKQKFYKNLPKIKNDLNYSLINESFKNVFKVNQKKDDFLYLNYISNLNGTNDFKIINDLTSEVEPILKLLNEAKDSIKIEIATVNYGVIWNQIKKILIKKANENISVIIIIDYFNSLKIDQNIFLEFKDSKNIKIDYFNKWKFFNRISQKKLRSDLNLLIIDNKIGYLNSLNLSESKSFKKGIIFTQGFKFEGEIVKHLSLIFNYFLQSIDKKLADKENSKINIISENLNQKSDDLNKSIIFSNNLNFKNSVFKNVYFNLLNISKKTIDIVTPTLMLNQDLKDFLILASSNNIKVRIITSETKRQQFSNRMSRYFEEELIAFGITIFKINNSFIDTNFLIIDKKYTLFGSNDLKNQTLNYHFQLNMLIYSPKIAINFEDKFNYFLKYSYLEVSNYLKWSISKQITYRFINYINPTF